MALSLRAIFVLALAVRLANALVSRTFFQPDEYWQSLEVAHRLVFGYGYQSWEWRALDGNGGIRSPLFPFFFVPVYALLKVTGLDGGQLLTVAPKLLQAVVAASCDVSTVALAQRLFGPRLTNAAASPSKLSLAGALGLAAVATLLRPSNVVIWIVMGLSLLVSANGICAKVEVASIAAAVGALAMTACVTFDTVFYGTLSFTPYTFLVQNVFNSISLFYGANPFHFYLTQALPFTTMTMLPFILHGLYIGTKDPKPRLAATVAFATIGAYSLLGHKEFRFIHPILPILHCFAAHSLVSFKSTTTSHSLTSSTLSIRPTHAALLLVSLGPAIYLTSFHALAQVTVMDTLRRIPNNDLKSVCFLMPGQNASTYRDQSDYFYDDPTHYLATRFPSSVDISFPSSPFVLPPSPHDSKPDATDLGWRHEWPSHIVAFDALLVSDQGAVAGLLEAKGYREWERLWNSHWHEDDRRRGDIVILRWTG
ncbi:hypothetical protein RQP46_005961 [Phenoliferia psychrophenolica]